MLLQNNEQRNLIGNRLKWHEQRYYLALAFEAGFIFVNFMWCYDSQIRALRVHFRQEQFHKLSEILNSERVLMWKYWNVPEWRSPGVFSSSCTDLWLQAVCAPAEVGCQHWVTLSVKVIPGFLSKTITSLNSHITKGMPK